MSERQATTKDTAEHLVKRLPKPEQVAAALEKVQAASSFELEHIDGPEEDPDSDFVTVFADGEEVASVWN